MYVSTKCNLGFNYHSYASWLRSIPAIVTLMCTPFLGQMIVSLNWSGVRRGMESCEGMANPRVSSEGGRNLW